MDHFKPIIAKVATGSPLTREEAEKAFDQILSGEATLAQMGAFLMALRVRGETVEEISGAVAAMRAKMLRVKAPEGALDIVGTGGDNSGSWNVSTLAAILAAATGLKIAKHGNRAASSKSGAADVLTALGVKVGIEPAIIERCIDQAGVGFMFAPAHHSSMRHVAPVRVEMGTRTIFNLLGPLSNPAGVKKQVIGVFSESWMMPVAETLKNLGSTDVWVVHGSDGLDEITTTGETKIVALKNGDISSFTITPEDAGLKRAKPEDLKGGDGEHNAKALMAVLDGERSAYRDIAVLNAAAALMVADRAKTLDEAARIVEAAIDDGRAKKILETLVTASNG
ncbi:MAG: anthranilate phosphoribosyltransferase [Beijerinckiaceae bacterium]|nr:anthranilate phosphoribosyltransferase [Beijerinckiaceae bacterium]